MLHPHLIRSCKQPKPHEKWPHVQVSVLPSVTLESWSPLPRSLKSSNSELAWRIQQLNYFTSHIGDFKCWVVIATLTHAIPVTHAIPSVIVNISTNEQEPLTTPLWSIIYKVKEHPWVAVGYKAVCPWSSWAAGFVPLIIRAYTQASWPLIAALWAAIQPLTVPCVISAPRQSYLQLWTLTSLHCRLRRQQRWLKDSRSELGMKACSHSKF